MSDRLALVVEDSEDQAELLRRMLMREGYEVTTAATAEAAIAGFGSMRPDIAIVDLLLPGISGGEFALQLRKSFPDCYLVISSVMDLTVCAGVDAILPKPVTSASVRNVLSSVPR